METAIGRGRRALGPVAAVLALGVLGTMVISGHLPENKQLVKFAPAGVMAEEPAAIDAVEVRTAAGRWRFVRGADGWRDGARALPAALGTHLDASIKFMHVSAPVRVMEPSEWTPVGLREFGLDPPGFVATLYRGETRVLEAAFGAVNPQQVLQYMRLTGRDQVFLMSRFIGAEWEQFIREAPRA